MGSSEQFGTRMSRAWDLATDVVIVVFLWLAVAFFLMQYSVV